MRLLDGKDDLTAWCRPSNIIEESEKKSDEQPSDGSNIVEGSSAA